jgi:altronate hydrolase
MGRSELLVVNTRDNVGIALPRLEACTEARVSFAARDCAVVVREEIPPLHKLALDQIPEGGQVFKHGHMIGRATRTIHPGMHVHTQRLEDEFGSL